MSSSPGCGVGSSSVSRREVAPCDFEAAGVEQLLPDVRQVVAQDVAQAGEEGVRMPHLRRPASIPRERLVRVRRQRRRVALEQHDLVAVAREEERRCQPGDAGAR